MLLSSSHTASLQLHPSLPLMAGDAHILPELTTTSLISIGQLCDHGCTATFTAANVTVDYQGATILTGTRSTLN